MHGLFLTATEMKVQEIAGHCGFEKMEYFCYVFKKGGGLYAVAVSPESSARGQKSSCRGRKIWKPEDRAEMKL